MGGCKDEAEKDGQKLIDALITFSGLPEGCVHQELSHILELYREKNGAESEVQDTDGKEMTLQELREAMAVYLDALHREMISEGMIVSE